MNYVKDVAKLLGLEMGEPFIVKNKGEIDGIYRFVEPNKSYVLEYNNGGNWETDYGSTFEDIISGYYEIDRFPYKPKENEHYYYLIDGTNIHQTNWKNSLNDLVNWKIGNCFRTEEEARSKGKEIMKNLQKEYDESVNKE